MIPTAHIELKDKTKLGKTVLMPGDPLRAKFIAETFLENVEQFNNVRNMFGYTGTYKGKKISVMGSGMGQPSIGIYSYELFAFYDVEEIIRIGSAGSYIKELNLYDVVLVSAAYSESSYASTMGVSKKDTLPSSIDTNTRLTNSAKKLGIPLYPHIVHSSDVFYRVAADDYKNVLKKHNAVAVEMESFALFANAKHLGKKASCLLTISDSFITKEVTTAKERQTAFTKMMEIALDAAL